MSLGSLVAYNAKACEEAVHPRCVCHCGGALHGKRHPLAWIQQTVADLECQQLGIPGILPLDLTREVPCGNS